MFSSILNLKRYPCFLLCTKTLLDAFWSIFHRIVSWITSRKPAISASTVSTRSIGLALFALPLLTNSSLSQLWRPCPCWPLLQCNFLFIMWKKGERQRSWSYRPVGFFLSLEVFNTILGELCVCESEAPYVETSLRLLSIQSALSGGFPLRGEQAWIPFSTIRCQDLFHQALRNDRRESLAFFVGDGLLY